MSYLRSDHPLRLPSPIVGIFLDQSELLLRIYNCLKRSNIYLYMYHSISGPCLTNPNPATLCGLNKCHGDVVVVYNAAMVLGNWRWRRWCGVEMLGWDACRGSMLTLKINSLNIPVFSEWVGYEMRKVKIHMNYGNPPKSVFFVFDKGKPISCLMVEFDFD